MSTHLGWEPAEPRPLGGSISVSMRGALTEQFCHGDGSAVIGVTLGRAERPWLQGVLAAAPIDSDLATDAGELLAAIAQYGTIKIVRDA